MLSTMESEEARELQRTLERAEAAPYLDYPQLPWWYPAAFGAWFAAMAALLLGYLSDPFGLLALVALIGVEIWFFRWFERKHGAMPWPGKGNPPAEIARIHRAYYIGCFAVLFAVALTWWLLGHWPAVAATFILATGGFWLYDVRFEAVAERVRERLA